MNPTPLNTPDTTTPLVRPQTIGTVHCINIARPDQPRQLRYFGASAVCGASGQAHATQAQAEQDVRDWADGKPVTYPQHAVVPLRERARYAPMVAAGVAAAPPAYAPNWIAVRERLPVDGTSPEADPFKTDLVLVARPAAPYVLEVAVGYRYDGNWYITREQSDEDDFVDNSVTHWQPLPAAPACVGDCATCKTAV